jgi:hypothetical protein
MTTRSMGSRLIAIACLAGAWLFAACDGGPSSEGSSNEACEGECGATGVPSDGGAGDGDPEPQRSGGPSTCFVPPGAACEYTGYGSGNCKGESDCSWNCAGLPKLCGEELVLYPFNDEVEGDLDCVLGALRDGTEGVFEWRMWNGIFQDKYTISILPGRRALRASMHNMDHYVDGGLDGPATLRDPSYFAACFGLTDVDALNDCLRNALDGCALPPVPQPHASR